MNDKYYSCVILLSKSTEAPPAKVNQLTFLSKAFSYIKNLHLLPNTRWFAKIGMHDS